MMEDIREHMPIVCSNHVQFGSVTASRAMRSR